MSDPHGARSIWLTSVDLDGPLPALGPPPHGQSAVYTEARVLVRLHRRPLGQVHLPLASGSIAADQLATAVQTELGAALDAHLAADGLPVPAPLTAAGFAVDGEPSCAWQSRLGRCVDGRPLVSVVLATYRRPERLRRTLQTIAVQTYDDIEVLVVDNAPSSPGAAEIVAALADPRFRLIDESQPGASRARNAGLRAARGEVVAFTDDDVDADPDWVGNLVVPFFEDPEVGCVTGLILPASLDTEAEQLIEQYGGFSKGFLPRTFTRGDTDQGPLYPYNAGQFGSGANTAFRREPFLELGGFPIDLGPATVARGGEDLDVYLSVLLAGLQLRYEPAAIVRHEHRRDTAQLARQVYSYGIGLSAMITKRVLASRDERRAVVRALPAAVRYVLVSDSPKNAGKTTSYPKRLTAYELLGLAYGPVAYLRSRARARRSVAAR